jgi:hypothetical protein
MENITEYAEKNMQPMTEKRFNAVDSLILTKLSYLHFDQFVPLPSGRLRPTRVAELLKAEFFPSIFRNQFDVESWRRFLFALGASPRYRSISMSCYVDYYEPALEKQFSAVTFFLEDKTAYIAYRGTDSTFIGWKEDFNMAYMSPVPSQEAGVEYLNTVAKSIPKWIALRVGGHSKGGNIAMYSAMKCSPNVQRRIIGVYNHDGPGFKNSVFETPEFIRIKDRIHTTLPESSLIGMLLQHHDNYSVVKSSKRGIMQHEPFSWIVENDDFAYANQVKSGALHRNKTLNEWLNQLTDENLKRIVDVMFEVVKKTKADTLQEFAEDWRGSISAMLSAVRTIDPESKKFLLQAVNELARLSFRKTREPVS